MSLGKEYSPLLVQIEDGLLDTITLKPNFTAEGFRAAIYIFQAAMFDKMVELQEKEKMNDEDCELMAKNLGEELRNYIGRFTGLDTYKIFNDEST
jgi:hypothetical protein